MTTLAPRTVNFGPSWSGLDGVGYALYRPDGALKQPRTDHGVFEVAPGLGVYAAHIAFDWDGPTVIVWDDGQSSPTYAVDTIPLLSSIGPVAFGTSRAGLSTVGYTIYNPDGTVAQARSTTGVVEYGDRTGCYGASQTLGAFGSSIVVWDTGQAEPRFVARELESPISYAGSWTTLAIIHTVLNQSTAVRILIEDRHYTNQAPRDVASPFVIAEHRSRKTIRSSGDRRLERDLIRLTCFSDSEEGADQLSATIEAVLHQEMTSLPDGSPLTVILEDRGPLRRDADASDPNGSRVALATDYAIISSRG